MSNYHKPRTFRSLHGCCICRAKSSSSRFTDSEKYEDDFQSCFKVEEGRAGDICNACVLLVKRWKKLPRGSKKHWNHVVDARAGPGGNKAYVRQRSKTAKDDPDLTKFKKIVKKQTRVRRSSYQPPTPDEDAEFCLSPTPSERSERSVISSGSEEISPFIDLSYWKRTEVCCGVVFKGRLGEVTIDSKLYKPCSFHRKGPISRTRTDTISSHSSVPSTDSGTHSADTGTLPPA